MMPSMSTPMNLLARSALAALGAGAGAEGTALGGTAIVVLLFSSTAEGSQFLF
jgi:hypothetical protein